MKQHLLIIGLVWPEPHSSAAGTRMLQLIRVFKEKGWRITFASAAQKSVFSAELETMDVGCKHILLNDGSFDVEVAALNPDVVVFDRYMTEEQFGWRIAENCPSALRILDTEDLHCLRKAREFALKRGVAMSDDLLLSDTAKREIASIYRCDFSLVISTYEMTLLTDFFKVPASLLFYIPFIFNEIGHDDFKFLPSFQDRSGFVFIGNFLHEPNVNAVKILKQEIWPKIRNQDSRYFVNVYGAYLPESIRQMHKPAEGFHVLGRAEEAAPVIASAKVMLAPIKIGAGLKGKLAEAMQLGTPSVTTTIGAEGMFTGTWNGFIENDSIMFSERAIQLHDDEKQWNLARNAGISLHNSLFSQSFGDKLIDRIIIAQKYLDADRKANFIGEMLRFHTMNSFRYMSKWIEEKNK